MKENTESNRFKTDFDIQASINGKPVKNSSLVLGLVVCVVDHVAGESRFHQTTRVYDVGRNSRDAPPYLLRALISNEDLPAPNVLLQGEIDGEFAD